MAKPIVIKIAGDLKELKSNLSEGERSIANFTTNIAAAGAAAAATVAAAFGAVVLSGINMQQDIQNALIAGTGALGDNLEGLVDLTYDVLATVPESGAIVAGTMADVSTYFGFTGDQLVDTTKLVLDFARITGVETNAVIGGIDAALAQFGSDSSVEEVLGDLLRISQDTGVPMGQLLGQLEEFGPVFAGLGFSLEETIGLYGQLEQIGVNVNRVSPPLNKFLRDAAAEGKDARETLEEVFDFIFNNDYNTALAFAADVFGAEGATRITEAIQSGEVSIEGLNELIGEGTGLVDAQSEAMLTLGDRFNILKNKGMAALQPLFEKALDISEALIQKLGPYLDDFIAWFKEDAIPAIQGFWEDVQPYLQALVDMFIDKIIPAAVALWDEISPVIDRLVKLFLETFIPIFNDVWENAKPIFDDLIELVVEDLWPAIQEAMEGIEEVITRVLNIIQAVWERVGDKILANARKTWEFTFNVIRVALDIIMGVFNTFVGLFTGDWGKMWDGIKRIFSGVWDGIKLAFIELPGVLLSQISTWAETGATMIDELLGGWPGKVLDIVGDIGSKALDIVKAPYNAFKWLMEQFANLWNSTLGGFGFTIPDWVRYIPGMGGLAGKEFRIPEINFPGSQEDFSRAPGTTNTQDRLDRYGMYGGLVGGGPGSTATNQNNIYFDLTMGNSDVSPELLRDLEFVMNQHGVI